MGLLVHSVCRVVPLAFGRIAGRTPRRGVRCGQLPRRERSVIERGPRPMATMPDWTSSLTP